MIPLPLLQWDLHPISGTWIAACFEVALTCSDETGLVTADCICIELVLNCDCVPTRKCTNNNADNNFMISTITWARPVEA